MTFGNYPHVLNNNIESVVQSIVESRDDDIKILDEIVRRINTGMIFNNAAQYVSGATQVGDSDGAIDVDASSGAVTITLESSPTNGQIHLVSKSDSSANAVTIDGNGNNINGSTTYSLTAQYDSITCVFIGGAGEWRIF